MKILGIDPGSARMGYGLIESSAGKLTYIAAGTVEASGKSVAEKIVRVGTELERLIQDFKPDRAGVEKLFFAKNQKTALEVAEARGVIMFLLRKSGTATVELAPNEIKAAVTGYGSADKAGVAKMVRIILNIPNLKGLDDATDALAIAIAADTKKFM